MTPKWERYLEDHQAQYVQELLDLCRIPSISASPEHAPDVQRAAEWIASRLRAAGLEEVQVMPTGGHPVVYGQWLHAAGAPTALIYGHFDVQPVDPLDQWTTPPFEPTIRDGRLYARGASDNKGDSLGAIQALEALLATEGALPINVKCLFEGQEEIGGPQVPAFVEANQRQLACDLVLNADGGQWSETEPSLSLGLRGICGLEVDVLGANSDLHSGGYGGAVQNPLHALAALIASLHTPDGGVAVEGFYDDVAPLGAEERAGIASVPYNEADYLARLGLQETFGEPGYSTYERTWARPTLEVNGLWGGFQGQGIKTVLPREAHAKITCRLVPNQEPGKVEKLVEAHVRRHAPSGVKVRAHSEGVGARPYLVPAEHPGNRAARDVLFELYGREPYQTRSGGSVPICETFLRYLGVHSIAFGFGLRDEQVHAPNEFFRLASYARGRRAYCMLLKRLAAGGGG